MQPIFTTLPDWTKYKYSKYIKEDKTEVPAVDMELHYAVPRVVDFLVYLFGIGHKGMILQVSFKIIY